MRGSIAERGGVRVGHRIIEINDESVVATSHQHIVELLATTVGEVGLLVYFFFPSASPCLANETALRSPNVSEFRRASNSESPVVISGSRVVDSSVSGFILSRICLILLVLLCL